MLGEKISISCDRIIDASEYSTTKPNGSVVIRLERNDPSPISIPSFVKHNCLVGGSQLAMAVKRKGDWMRWTYSQYYKEIRLAAKAFIKLGLQPFYSVCIYGFNCPEWLISNLGTIFAGGLATGLYPTNSASMNEYLMNNSRCEILVVESEAILQKVRPVLDNVETLKKIVVIEEEGFVEDEDSILWKDLLELGREETDEQLNERLDNIAVNQCCCLIYTSGTTGNPKGVMVSHDSITYTASMVVEKHDWKKIVSVVSYLPLSHIAANMLDIYVVMQCRGQVYFADKSAMKGSLIQTLREVRPSLFLAVPRVYEKFQEGILEKTSTIKKSEKILAAVFRNAAFSYNTTGNQKIVRNMGNRLFYQKVKTSLGLERCREFICGGAPLVSSTEEFFLSLDIVIKTGYGLSECGLFSDFSRHEYLKGSCGSIFPSTKGKFLKSEDENLDGELLIRGRSVMMGYLNNESATADAFDEHGYFSTGDLGYVNDQGFYFITGRKKELLITAGGENVAPLIIEDNIKQFLPVVSNAVAIGDLKKFISVFLTLKVTRDKDGSPTVNLTNAVKDWCRSHGSNVETITDIIQNEPPGIMRAIQKGIDEANKKAVSNAAKVKKWSLVPRELSMDAGEIGPTLKLKRTVFNRIHYKQIDNFYV